MTWEAIAGILAGIVLLAAALPASWRFLKAAARGPAALERIAVEFGTEGGGPLSRSLNSLNDSIEHLRDSNHAIVGRLDVVVANSTLHGQRLDQHLADDALFNALVLKKLATAEVAADQVKQNLARSNEIDTLAVEGRIDRRHDDLASLHERLNEIHDELRTMNGLTVGEMTDANETRRIEALPEDKRTEGDLEHLEADEDQ